MKRLEAMNAKKQAAMIESMTNAVNVLAELRTVFFLVQHKIYLILYFPENVKSSKIKNESQSYAGTPELAATMVDLGLDNEKIGLLLSEKKIITVFLEDLPLHQLNITPTKKKRRSDTSKMTISGMKDNPYGFGQPIDQPALSLNVSYLHNLQI